MTVTALIYIYIRHGSLVFDIEFIFLRINRNRSNLLFLKAVRIISLCIFTWRLFYISPFKRTLFYFSLLIFVFSILLLTVRDRLISLFLGWEGLGITSFVLIIFYQNWIRAKGGLLTLLTNRLGDAILLITLCRFLSSLIGDILLRRSLFLTFIFMMLTLTKRAQWPFIRWLPAAIAAPTPVRSLVHSSTLVTAGVWLIIRFRSTTILNIILWGTLGILTLTVASLSALLEVDAKKIVALSTLRQLGLIFIALSFGTPSICLFHILIHALAKANLFIVVGGLLHRRFSQQDARLINSRATRSFVIKRIIISLFRLVGVTFTSGFFSKEQILINQSFIRNRSIFNLLLILIVGATLAYCTKFFFRILSINPEGLFLHTARRKTQYIPVFFIRLISVFRGFVYYYNTTPSSLLISRIERIYWTIRVLGFILLSARVLWITDCYKGFFIQSKMIDLLVRRIKKIKLITSSLEASEREIILLLTRYLSTKVLKLRIRLIFLFSLGRILLIRF